MLPRMWIVINADKVTIVEVVAALLATGFRIAKEYFAGVQAIPGHARVESRLSVRTG